MKKAFLIVSVALLLSSCAITLPVNATSNEVGSKVGMSKATGYLNVIWIDQDASIQKAAKQGGITKISTVDLKQTNMLGIIQTYECIVTGN
jgi:starvation-inducible outer membrane lipoprotein|tara:strand:- start:15 stop:287 length:273 start_codon:yes stop_codon:yes gene_type:complete